MSDYTLSDDTRAKLKKVSTASVATALYKRGLRNQFIQGVVPVAPKDENMVGQAFTLRYIPAREDRNPITVFRNPDHPQRVAMETCPPGHVLVMDARKDARAATAGSILITRLALRGAAGVVSDGGFRDAEGIGALDMPAYYAKPSAPTNLTLHEALDINVPISCGDAPVFPGDVLVGDKDGVMVIPAHLADELADECTGMESFEDFVLEEVKAGTPIIGLYPPTAVGGAYALTNPKPHPEEPQCGVSKDGRHIPSEQPILRDSAEALPQDEVACVGLRSSIEHNPNRPRVLCGPAYLAGMPLARKWRFWAAMRNWALAAP